jgi:hypothetical protein
MLKIWVRAYLLSHMILLWPFLGQYTIAMLGYGPEDKSAVLELTYNYGVTEYDKGNAYAQVSGNSSFFLFFFSWNLLNRLSLLRL